MHKKKNGLVMLIRGCQPLDQLLLTSLWDDNVHLVAHKVQVGSNDRSAQVDGATM